MQTFTTDQVMAATGATYRQVDYWVTLGYLPVPTRGTGVPRLWSREQVSRAGRLTALVAAGLEPRHAARIADQQATTYGAVTITLDTDAIERQIDERIDTTGQDGPA